MTDAEIEPGTRCSCATSWSTSAATSFFGAYMQKAKQALKITIREEVLARITGV